MVWKRNEKHQTPYRENEKHQAGNKKRQAPHREMENAKQPIKKWKAPSTLSGIQNCQAPFRKNDKPQAPFREIINTTRNKKRQAPDREN